MKRVVERLSAERNLDAVEMKALIEDCDDSAFDLLRQKAVAATLKRWGRGVFVRGLIEVSSYCRNNCLYCGLRRDNRQAERYRLSDAEVIGCCEAGYNMGLRTFVLQGGEDVALDDDRLDALVSQIHAKYPDAAITLSLGERSKESYQRLYDAGASRYLLRHEAADAGLYRMIHPEEMLLQNRLRCVANLQEIGYQTGMGMMIGVPGQTASALVEDVALMKRLGPQMIGVGPFIAHGDTPFGEQASGSLRQTLLMIAILRLMFPDALIPATTALSTLSPDGHRQGVLSGANVVMPNLTPVQVRSKYSIYENKRYTGSESAEGLSLLAGELEEIGYHIDYSRGDYKRYS